MKDHDGRRFFRFLPWGSGLRPSPLAATLEAPHGGPAAAEPVRAAGSEAARRLAARIGTAALAFRGYDQANLGRSAELLARPAYAPIVRDVLAEASQIAAEAIKRPVDLVAYVRNQTPSSLETFAEDVALIVGMELAQVRILAEVFGVPIDGARLSFGYSIGELSAMVVGGTYRLDQILPVPLMMADDCAALAEDCHMGVLFTRGAPLPAADVERLCEAVRSEGAGLIGPSAYLSPNTALILGQGDTLDVLERMMPEFLPAKAMLRRKEHRWPPLHSPLVWQANIPNRTAMAIYRIVGGKNPPRPRVISCVTGAPCDDPVVSRETLIRWTDAPQRLWDAITCVLGSGVETVVHVGPSPNLIPATFTRLSNNINKHLVNKYLHALGRGVVASMNRHAWLGHALPSQAALLRAPFLEHIILEDWLLDQEVA
jgi:[acyl-carrier-protein] S-malonyltransferase